MAPAVLPRYRPMLATSGLIVGDAAGWAFEPKLDGWRVLVYCDGGSLTVRTRSGRDVSAHLPELDALADVLCDRRVVLDGELVAHDGTPQSFYSISARMMRRPSDAWLLPVPVPVPLTFVAFDVVYDGEDVTREAYCERRARLERLAFRGPSWCTLASFPGLGAELFAACHALGLEGLVAKRLDSPYRQDRSRDWVKAKTDAWRQTHAGSRHEGGVIRAH